VSGPGPNGHQLAVQFIDEAGLNRVLVMDLSARLDTVEFRIREWRATREQFVGAALKDHLRQWLSIDSRVERDPMAIDDIELLIDRQLDEKGTVAFRIPNALVPAWTLTRADLERLEELVR
jgi:hypothetical protein